MIRVLALNLSSITCCHGFCTCVECDCDDCDDCGDGLDNSVAADDMT